MGFRTAWCVTFKYFKMVQQVFANWTTLEKHYGINMRHIINVNLTKFLYVFLSLYPINYI